MPRFKHTDNSQGQFMAANPAGQLLPDTFEWAIDYLISKMDLPLFAQNCHNDKKGAAAYSPGILLKITLYCYSRGIITSRRIEKACKGNIIAKALAEGSEPGHDAIATFISTDSEAVKRLPAQALLKCSELKLITGETSAIGGRKLPPNASKERPGKLGGLTEKRDKLKKHIARILFQRQELDKNENAKKARAPFKKTVGGGNERRQRGIERLENKLKRLGKFLETAGPRKGAPGGEAQSNITGNEGGRIKGPRGYIQGYNGIAAADSGGQAIVSADVIGTVAEGGCFPEMLDNLEETVKTVTGKEKPLKKAPLEGGAGYFSEENLREAKKRGINALIPDPQFRRRGPYFAGKKREKIPKGSRFTIEDSGYNKKEGGYICPAGKKLTCKGGIKLRNGGGKKCRGSVKGCRQCPFNGQRINIKKGKLKKRPQRVRSLYIAESKHKENLSEKMREKIGNPACRELYPRRMQITEPVFSDITYCKGVNRFTMRTEKKVNIQWQLYCIAHNMGKCMKAMRENEAA